VPDPQSPDTFRRSQLDWQELEKEPHASIHEWYRDLVALRRREPALSDPTPGSAVVEVNQEFNTITVRRGAISVMANLSAEPRSFDFPDGAAPLAFSAGSLKTEAGRMILPPDSVAIIKDPTEAL
jgi:maltooligosyltrehalose trehalohydrolase